MLQSLTVLAILLYRPVAISLVVILISAFAISRGWGDQRPQQAPSAQLLPWRVYQAQLTQLWRGLHVRVRHLGPPAGAGRHVA